MVTNVTVTSTVVVQLTADQNNALLAPSTPGFDPAVEIMFGRCVMRDEITRHAGWGVAAFLNTKWEGHDGMRPRRPGPGT